MTLTVTKRHKRLMIVDGEGRAVYAPPDFIQVTTRQELAALAAEMMATEHPIDAIMAYESRARRVRSAAINQR